MQIRKKTQNLQKIKKMSKEKKQRKITWVTALQSVFLTGDLFIKNDLISYASACTFGFLFSFIPILMIILVILIRFLHASPDTILSIINSANIFAETFDLESIVTKILSIKKITNFEIIMGIGILWMARRFFSSIMSGMNSIYTRAVPSKPVLSQIIILAGEAILIVLSSVLILIFISFNTIKNTQHFAELLPFLFTKGIKRFMNILPSVILFFVMLLFYKEMSIAKVTWRNCAISAAASTISFWLFQRLLYLFINVNKYNLVYGVLSKVFVLLMEICFFFWIFFFFAQFLFVITFFDEILLGELYILPGRNDTGFFSSFKRLLFIRPDYLLHEDVKTIHLKKGDYIYKSGSSEDVCFYLAKGAVEIIRENNITFAERGDFIGEEICVLNEKRKDNAIAYTDCDIVKISGDEFRSLLDKNSDAGKKALSKISFFYSKIYYQKKS